jgi:activator of 2-hydroxyglutaryl-CoA dehydratase
VGSQSSRVIKVSPKGKVADCLVSDKCAAGSGRILQIIAKVLGITIEEMGKLSLQATQPAKFTTGCAVFLETEAISRVAEGTAKEDIIAGLHHTLKDYGKTDRKKNHHSRRPADHRCDRCGFDRG